MTSVWAAQKYAEVIKIDSSREALWVDQTENLSGVFLHRSLRLDIFISDLVAQQRDLMESLFDENLNCIERPLQALHGGDMVLSCSTALILRRDHELEITSATEPTGNAHLEAASALDFPDCIPCFLAHAMKI
jgi:hypothetical protein